MKMLDLDMDRGRQRTSQNSDNFLGLKKVNCKLSVLLRNERLYLSL